MHGVQESGFWTPSGAPLPLPGMGVNAKIRRGPPLSLFPSPTSARDFVAVIAGVQRISGPLQVKYWGVRTPAALTPMLPVYDINLIVTSSNAVFKILS